MSLDGNTGDIRDTNKITIIILYRRVVRAFVSVASRMFALLARTLLDFAGLIAVRPVKTSTTSHGLLPRDIFANWLTDINMTWTLGKEFPRRLAFLDYFYLFLASRRERMCWNDVERDLSRFAHLGEISEWDPKWYHLQGLATMHLFKANKTITFCFHLFIPSSQRLFILLILPSEVGLNESFASFTSSGDL